MSDKESKNIIHIDNIPFYGEIKQMLRNRVCNSVTIVARGNSMRPFLEDHRDKIVLSAPLPPQKGQVVLAEVVPGRFVLHRITKIEGKSITMRGDGNALSQTETFNADDIIGTATMFIRKGKEIGIDSRTWRAYSAIWAFLSPLRRILLAIYRRII